MIVFVIDLHNLVDKELEWISYERKKGETMSEEMKKETQKFDHPKRERTQIMTPKEAAKYLGFHLVTIYRLLKKREVPAVKIGGQWRFKKDILDAWLAERMEKS